jgi:hypothetical protein
MAVLTSPLGVIGKGDELDFLMLFKCARQIMRYELTEGSCAVVRRQPEYPKTFPFLPSGCSLLDDEPLYDHFYIDVTSD